MRKIVFQKSFKVNEFMELPEPPAAAVLPESRNPEYLAARMVELAHPRLKFLAGQSEEWWLEVMPFFDVERERIWIFWRRVLHTCHHRTRLPFISSWLDKKVPSTYGPTADVTWEGADPTLSGAAASRK